MTIRKQFDPVLFEENDARARAAVAGALSTDGVWCRPNDDRYGLDLLVYAGYRHTHYIEVEIKRVWLDTHDSFPWSTVQVPERKRRLAEATRKPVEFWILRSDLKFAVIIPEEALVGSPLVEVPNRLVSSGEKFFQVPVSECILRKLGE